MKQINYKLAGKGLGKDCEVVLRLLPEWFGREESLVDYVNEINNLDTYTASINDELVGFFSIKYHFEESVELYVLGVKPEFHGKGIGSTLFNLIERQMKKKSIRFIQVKTLSPRAKDKEYLQTLKFYRRMGFVSLEDFPDFWGEDTPCLQLIKHI